MKTILLTAAVLTAVVKIPAAQAGEVWNCHQFDPPAPAGDKVSVVRICGDDLWTYVEFTLKSHWPVAVEVGPDGKDLALNSRALSDTVVALESRPARFRLRYGEDVLDIDVSGLRMTDVPALAPVSGAPNLPFSDSAAVPSGTHARVVLDTAVNTELPGVLLARLAEPVYGPGGRYVAAPRGTTFVASVHPLQRPEDTRVSACFDRAVLPDGSELVRRDGQTCLGHLVDPQGRVGLTGRLISRSKEQPPVLEIAAGTLAGIAIDGELHPIRRIGNILRME